MKPTPAWTKQTWDEWNEFRSDIEKGKLLRPVEDQAEFYLSESDRMIFEIFDNGNCNEQGCEVGELDWPTL